MFRNLCFLAGIFSFVWFLFSLMALQLGRPYPEFFCLLQLDNSINQFLSTFMSLTMGFLAFVFYRLQPKPYRVA